MMLITALYIGALASLYALEYFWRAWKLSERRYMYIGKACGRLILGSVYLWVAIFPSDAETRAIWVRWALLMFLLVDLIFVVLDHLLRRINAQHP